MIFSISLKMTTLVLPKSCPYPFLLKGRFLIQTAIVMQIPGLKPKFEVQRRHIVTFFERYVFIYYTSVKPLFVIISSQVQLVNRKRNPHSIAFVLYVDSVSLLIL